MTTLTLRIDTLYVACSPELGVLSYGQCRDEALNNLAADLQSMHSATGGGKPTGDERK